MNVNTILSLIMELPLPVLIFKPEYAFLRTALLAALLASVSFGIVGTFVVVRRIGYLAGAISHCAFGGIGIGLYLKATFGAGILAFVFHAGGTGKPENIESSSWFDPITFIALVVAVFCAILIGFVREYAKEREDSIIGAIWALGMAVGILLFNRTNVPANLSSYLFGEIFLTSKADLVSLGLLGIFLVLFFIVFFKRFEAVCFDEEFATLRGLPGRFYFLSLLVITAITVVIMVRVVGILLVIAMLSIPAASAGRLCKRLFPMMLVSIGLCFVCSWGGIFLSVRFNTAAGPMIVLVASAAYGLILAFEYLVKKVKGKISERQFNG